MKPEFIIVHHTGGGLIGDTSKIFNSVRQSHINRGWGDIGYHWFIERNGDIVQGRAENRAGAHCKDGGMNFKSIGICLAGNFERQNPTEAQLRSLEIKMHDIMNRYNIPPENVLPHREPAKVGTRTVCPGANLTDNTIKKMAYNKTRPLKNWEENAVKWAMEKGVSTGVRPLDNITRVEAMEMIRKYDANK